MIYRLAQIANELEEEGAPEAQELDDALYQLRPASPPQGPPRAPHQNVPSEMFHSDGEALDTGEEIPDLYSGSSTNEEQLVREAIVLGFANHLVNEGQAVIPSLEEVREIITSRMGL